MRALKRDKSIFAILSLILGAIVFITAGLIFIVTYWELPETYILTVISFPLIVILTLPEAPLHALSLRLGFPVVLPVLSLALALVSHLRRESRRRLALCSVLLVAVGLALYLALRTLD